MWHKAPFSCLICAHCLDLHNIYEIKHNRTLCSYFFSKFDLFKHELEAGLVSLLLIRVVAQKRQGQAGAARSTRNQLHSMYFTHNLSSKYCTTCPPIAHMHSHINDQKWDPSFPVGSRIRMDFASASSCSHFIRDDQLRVWKRVGFFFNGEMDFLIRKKHTRKQS